MKSSAVTWPGTCTVNELVPVIVICCTSRLKVLWPLTESAKLPPDGSTVTVWTLFSVGVVEPSRSVAVRTSTVMSGLLLTRELRDSSATHSSGAKFRPAKVPPKTSV